MKFATYDAFWGFYLRAHSKPGTRAWHYAGTVAGLICLGISIGFQDWRWVPGGLVVGYGCAWTGHFGIQKNKPATFGHPFWSFYSDFRMLGYFLSGRLAGELRRFDVT